MRAGHTYQRCKSQPKLPEMGKAPPPQRKKGTLRRKGCPSTATELGTPKHLQEFGFQTLLEDSRTVPLGTYPQDLPGQEILTGIQLLVIHQEVDNPRLQDVDFRRHIPILKHKPMGEETKHQILRAERRKAPSSWEWFCTPNTTTTAGDGSNPAQIHPLLRKDTHLKAVVPRKMCCWDTQVLQHPTHARWEGTSASKLRSCVQAGASLLYISYPVQDIFSPSSFIVYCPPITIFLCPGLNHCSLKCKRGKGSLFHG